MVKTSLLRYVRERIDEFCSPEQKPLIVSMDLQKQHFHTPEGIIEGLRRGISRSIGEGPWQKEANDSPFEIEDSLRSAEGTRISSNRYVR